MDILRELSHELFINGKFEGSVSSLKFEVLNPADNTVISEVSDSNACDAKKAVSAAADGFNVWKRRSTRERAEILRKCYDLMILNRDNIATLISLEEGKTLQESLGEVAYASEFFRWFSEEAVRIGGELSRSPSGANNIIVKNEPVGICYFVTPWNFPAAMVTRKIAPALAAGCSVILKPSEETPLTALYLGQLFIDAGIDPGVVNILPTTDPEQLTSTILEDQRVRKVSFTGSTKVGKHLLRKASDRVVNCSMELGGNAPFLILDDADIEVAVNSALIAKMRNAGESCIAANRFYVHHSIEQEFATKLSERMKALNIGNGLDENVDVGPLINSQAVTKVHSLVIDALEKGAYLHCGGELIANESCFYYPTVISKVPSDSLILNEEIFGPVATIVSFNDEQDVIDMANNTPFGLAAYIISSDVKHALNVASSLEAGVIGINQGFISDPAAPFGGVKQSGLGREGGSDGIWEFIEKKYIAIDW
ncbi:NAD-dependent succinate-semialdehyde dehydrogenase [Vibrio crassostreae]|uniref:NAD-dependent succinate-semialdehyde dehydrogenase n=1 Tax=Vibrio crassostreae TaxID=246167 RepID=UPI001B312AAE|nr:NAD-dependent succinate-semialdehyde dehydrogenase [Vibrio crassostreae]